MRPSETIVPSNMIRGGGVVVTTAVCLSLEVGILEWGSVVSSLGGYAPNVYYAYDGPIYGYNGRLREG